MASRCCQVIVLVERPDRCRYTTRRQYPQTGDASGYPQVGVTQNRETSSRSLLPTRNQSTIQSFILWGKFRADFDSAALALTPQRSR